jgi:hypothetical protein
MTVTVSSADGEPGGQGVTPRPIVLTLNCESAAEYLKENEVLMCLGLNLVRFDIYVDPIYTSTEIATQEENAARIHHEEHPDLTWVEMDRQLHNPAWLMHEVGAFIDNTIKGNVLKRWYTPDQVKVVLVHADLLQGDANVMEVMLTSRYENAGFFGVGHQQFGSRPGRLWNGTSTETRNPDVRWSFNIHYRRDLPHCPECGTQMRPAGSAYVCEHCGRTLGAYPLD